MYRVDFLIRYRNYEFGFYTGFGVVEDIYVSGQKSGLGVDEKSVRPGDQGSEGDRMAPRIDQAVQYGSKEVRKLELHDVR